MAKPGPKVGWAQKLRDDLAFCKACSKVLEQRCIAQEQRIGLFNDLPYVLRVWHALIGGKV